MKARTSQGPGRLILCSLRVLALGLIVWPIAFWQGGVLETEATGFIINYLDNRDVLHKVFDPHRNDFNTYQARELSYFIDYLDAQFFKILFGIGLPLFVPASSIVASILILLTHQFGTATIMPNLSKITSTLVLLLYFSNYVPFVTTAVFYRSAKPLLAALVFVLLIMIKRFHKVWISGTGTIDRPSSIYVIPITLLLCVSMALIDRQGFFYICVATLILGIHCLQKKGRADIVVVFACSVAFSIYYNLVLGPQIIRAVNGYWPDLSYQRLKVFEMFTNPVYLYRGLIMVVEQIWIFYGSLPAWVWVAGLCVAGYRIWTRTARPLKISERLRKSRIAASKELRNLNVWSSSIVFISLIIMNALMVLRHPPVYEYIDHRLWYYAVPTQILFVFGTLLFLDRLIPHLRDKHVMALNILLLAMIVHSITCWWSHKDRMIHSQWFHVPYYQSTYLKESLKYGKSHPSLADSHKYFFEYSSNWQKVLTQNRGDHHGSK